jgi:hypothetical protein
MENVESVHPETALSPDCRVAQSPWKSGPAETAKGAGPFQKAEVRQRDNRWQHANQNGHVRMYAPLFRLPRALHSNEIARFRMDTREPKIGIESTCLPGSSVP